MQSTNSQYPIIYKNLSFQSLSLLLVTVLSNEVDSFLGLPGALENSGDLDAFDAELSSLLNQQVSLKSNWVNVVKFREVDNRFHWHKDEQYAGEFVGIFWMFGEEGKGGDLYLMLDGAEVKIDFSPGCLVIFPKDVLHNVAHYSGTLPRVSLNFTF